MSNTFVISHMKKRIEPHLGIFTELKDNKGIDHIDNYSLPVNNWNRSYEQVMVESIKEKNEKSVVKVVNVILKKEVDIDN